MKIDITNGVVTLDASDAQGRGVVRTMTLEQYKKHTRDPLFASAIAPADVATIDAAAAAAAVKP